MYSTKFDGMIKILEGLSTSNLNTKSMLDKCIGVYLARFLHVFIKNTNNISNIRTTDHSIFMDHLK